MVTYGARAWVERSVDALVSATSYPFELVVVDNASPEGTGAWLRAELRGATLLENRLNLGYPVATNQGVAYARAPYLCLLNPDAAVEPGWLEPMLEVLEEDPAVGAVVPVFFGADARVQEAGALVSLDGRTLGLDAGAPAPGPTSDFRRAVDYGSAACMLMRRAEFVGVGGLGPEFGIGYCEDVDLCFRLAAAGSWTVLEPRSRVVHASGATAAPGPDRVARWNRNNDILRRRWRPLLSSRPVLPPGPSGPYEGDEERAMLAARDACCPMRIVLLVTEVSRATVELAERLAGAGYGLRVTVASRSAAGTGAQAKAAGTISSAASRVELALGLTDLEAWIRRRRWQVSTVVLGSEGEREGVQALLRRWQPQASVVTLEDRELARRWPGGLELAPLAGDSGLLAWLGCSMRLVRRPSVAPPPSGGPG